VWTTRQSRLGLIFAVIGGAAWWLVRELTQEPPRLPHGRVPTHVVSDLQAVETDAAGRPKQRLLAGQWRQFPAEDRSELDMPRLTLFDPAGAPPWRAAARYGTLLSGGSEVWLTEDVAIERDGTADARPVRLTTAELRVWPKREYAQSDRPVRLESDRDWLTASGLKLWYATPSRAEFSGRVHIYLAPEPDTAGADRETSP
jgi:lipopolysaccharide export system protein LptC